MTIIVLLVLWCSINVAVAAVLARNSLARESLGRRIRRPERGGQPSSFSAT